MLQIYIYRITDPFLFWNHFEIVSKLEVFWILFKLVSFTIQSSLSRLSLFGDFFGDIIYVSACSPAFIMIREML